MYQRYQKIICKEIITLVRTIKVELLLCHQNSCNQWVSLIKVIQIRVKIGIIIHILGEASLSSQCSNIALNQRITFKTRKNKARVAKKREKIIQRKIVSFVVLIAAEAEKPTHTIIKAKTESIWERLLLFTKSAFHDLSTNLTKYSLNIFKAESHIIQKDRRAKGKRYSTIFQSHGIKIAHSIKNTFTVIAKVRGRAISVTSDVVFFISSKDFVFLKSKYFFVFQISIFKWLKAKNNIQRADKIITIWKIISHLSHTSLRLSKVGITNFSLSLGIINIRYIKKVTLIHPGQRADKNSKGL